MDKNGAKSSSKPDSNPLLNLYKQVEKLSSSSNGNSHIKMVNTERSLTNGTGYANGASAKRTASSGPLIIDDDGPNGKKLLKGTK